MKAFIIGTFAAGAAAGATYLAVSNHQPAHDWSKEKASLEATFQAEKDRLQAELEKERKRSGRVETVEVEVSTALSPDQIMERLKSLHPSSEKQKNLREIMFHFQSLVAHKDNAVPAISRYLALNEDISYNFNDSGRGPFGSARRADTPTQAATTQGRGELPPSNNRQGRQGRGSGAEQGDVRQSFGRFARTETNPTLEFFLPPSLRIGLIDVLNDIGGSAAENALSEVLKNSGRGVEIALTSHYLEQIAPGRYTEISIGAAKELIPNLPEIENPDRQDQNAKGYLYGILKQHNDTTFVPTAKQLLVTANGEVDPNALDYLNAVLKDQSVSLLMEAYNDPKLTSTWAKAPLAQQILAQVGANSQANELLYRIVSDREQNSMAKSMAIASLAGGGRGPFGGGAATPTDPAILQSRLQVLGTIKQTLDPSDNQTLSAIRMTEDNLGRLLRGEEPMSPMEMIGGFGGRGGNGGSRRRAE